MTDTARRDFVNTVGDVLASWNLPRATGRVYGHLLLCSEPTTLDEVSSALGLSKGSVSTSVRELSSWGLARTIPQPGSRRLLIEAEAGFERLLAASHERTRAFVRTLRQGSELTDDDAAQRRLADVITLFETYVDVGDEMLRRARRSGS